MKKRIITIIITSAILISMGVVLASNKSKIDAAAKPVKETPRIPVKTVLVDVDSFATAFSINGTTSPYREVPVASEVQGKLVELYVNNGDMVKAGQVIAVLDASVYAVQLASVEASIAKSNLDLERYNHLIAMGGATPMQAESVQLQINSLYAQKKEILERMDHMKIRAPFSGRIENVGVERGSFVSYGTVLGQLIDNSSLKINIYLSESEAFQVKEGQVVSISSAVISKPKEGRIATVSNKADASGKFLAEIHFTNEGNEKLKAGMLTDVVFSLGGREKGLSIPVSALLSSTKGAEVYVVRNDHVEKRAIKTGRTTASKVQVTEGLEKGEQVVTSGQLNLESGSLITINK